MPLAVSVKYFVSLLVLFTAGNVCAQTFSPQVLPAPQKSSSMMIPTEKAPEAKELTSTDETINQLTKALSKKEQQTVSVLSDEENDLDKEDIFIPKGELYRLDTPTLDGSLRGGQSFVEVDDRGRMKKTTKIFLFYDEFKILNPTSKVPTCNVRFNILSTLNRKITQLDVKLVWPGLTTTLSFSDIMPNTQTYYNYALLSAGCFNMDKAPNIVVNRCRVKGMTSMECANKLLWLSK